MHYTLRVFMVEVYVFELHYKGFILYFVMALRRVFGCIKLLRYQDSEGYG
jgi:hypothetical protein